MKTSDKTLAGIRSALQSEPRVYRVSDFVSEEQVEQLRLNNGRRRKKRFDEVDAFEAEIVARFGYEVYIAWEEGEISSAQISKWVLAERARESADRLTTLAVLANGFAGCAHAKKGQVPKTVKTIQKIVKQEIKMAKGDL